MKIDMTLLEKDSAPTIAELKAFFRDHDFSTQVSKYDPMTASEEQNRVYDNLRMLRGFSCLIDNLGG